jgi:hypothetical protein
MTQTITAAISGFIFWNITNPILCLFNCVTTTEPDGYKAKTGFLKKADAVAFYEYEKAYNIAKNYRHFDTIEIR